MTKKLNIIIHIGFWAYLSFIITNFIVSIKSLFGSAPSILEIITEVLPVILWLLGSFYVFYLLIAPMFIRREKNKKIVLSSLIILCLIFTVLSIQSGSNFGVDIVYLFLPTVSFASLGFLFKVFHSWMQDRQIKQELENKNLQSELALVRSQINPHFLFNTLNNIEELTRQNPEMASSSIIKLSDIMRYMLTAANQEYVDTGQEMEYIRNYIDLQKIRSVYPESITLEISDDFEGLRMPPMLFIPFIENAFKHKDNGKDSFVNINIKQSSGQIILYCKNSYNKDSAKDSSSGIGIGLTRKRLDYLFPEKYSLDITQESAIFSVTLILQYA